MDLVTFETMIGRSDKNGDAQLDLNEFPEFLDMIVLPKEEKYAQIKSLLFEEIDVDDDGLISIAEMLNARLLKDRVTQQLLYPEEEIIEGMSKIDQNGDGSLCLQEFLLLMDQMDEL